MEYLASPIIILFPIVGVFSIFTMLFSQVYVAVQVGLFLPLKYLPAKFKSGYLWIYSLSSVLLWLSIFITRHNLLTEDMTEFSAAGFPFRVFTFPCCAMGGDYVPLSMWAPFYFNYLIWIVVSSLLVVLLARCKLLNNNKAERWLLAICIVINLSGLGMLLLVFD